MTPPELFVVLNGRTQHWVRCDGVALCGFHSGWFYRVTGSDLPVCAHCQAVTEGTRREARTVAEILAVTAAEFGYRREGGGS